MQSINKAGEDISLSRSVKQVNITISRESGFTWIFVNNKKVHQVPSRARDLSSKNLELARFLKKVFEALGYEATLEVCNQGFNEYWKE